MGLIARFKKFFQKEEPVKIGLALGSGGAKGMAHLGVLKAFEEAGIVVSCVAGTSIGSIVGALLAHGYSSGDMVSIIENLNRKEFAKNLRPFSEMSFAEEFLDNYLEAEFSSLKIPFACWATDGETNEGRRFTEGKLSRALAASSAMPPFFKGVEIDGRRYYDGAFSNAIPADVVRELGAEIVIGVDLSANKKPDSEKGRISRLVGSALNYLSPVHNLENNKSRGYEAADVMLCPDLTGFLATDVDRTSMDQVFELGYEEAHSRLAEIFEKIENFRKRK